MRLYVEDVWDDGTHVIHARHPEKHGKGYILFLPDGDFQIGRSSEPGKLLPEKESAYQKISARQRRPNWSGIFLCLKAMQPWPRLK